MTADSTLMKFNYRRLNFGGCCKTVMISAEGVQRRGQQCQFFIRN